MVYIASLWSSHKIKESNTKYISKYKKNGTDKTKGLVMEEQRIDSQ